MRRKFVAGNWKMNTLAGSATALAKGLAEGVLTTESVDVAVFPPLPYLAAVSAAVAGSGVRVGAQNVYHEKPGAFTGEVSVEMLVDVGCQWVLVGHSERRHLVGECNSLVNRKLIQACERGLSVILCVGETLLERQSHQTEMVLNSQMAGSLLGVDAALMPKIVIAYEPVWAIGTGVNATPDQAESAHHHLRTWLAGRYNRMVSESTRILYGGSVKANNAKELLSLSNVDGVLVGGASLEVEGFSKIIQAARDVSR